ncbi:nucleoside phosphorylase domain-containing protein [Aspergillus germanicus]
MPAIKRLPPESYSVGWISALSLELTAAKAMLDETHATPRQPSTDVNTYTVGAISGHNVVIAPLPVGVYGTTSATFVTASLLATFPCIRFVLMVGIGGGVPRKDVDIRLGDVVVSKPTGTHCGVVQYDYGKTLSDGRFERTGSLNKPPPSLLTALAELQSRHLAGESRIAHILETATQDPKLSLLLRRPDSQRDLLFEADYDHARNGESCDQCDTRRLVQRKERSSEAPTVHYGLIASGNQVMKHGRTRDRVANETGILCFEMEAAGLMDQVPCLVIRGICDYSDSHKMKEWQGYAAATAAAYTKELLIVPPAPRSKSSYRLNHGHIRDMRQPHHPFKMTRARMNAFGASSHHTTTTPNPPSLNRFTH